jgi:integrase
MMIMTNEKNNSLFKASTKEQYLNEIKETTRQSYERIFRITKDFEIALDKDINQFTQKELETVLFSFKANNRNTIESYARIISSYLNWSVKHNLVGSNLLESYKPDDFEKFLIDEETYIPERKLRRYEDNCENYQDAVILRLLFMGVGGKKLSEIRNLKVADVNFRKREIKLTNTLKEDANGNPVKFTERYLKVDDRTLDLIEGAIGQETYVKRNGQMVERDNVRPFTDLVANDYVVRASITKTEHFNAPVDKFVIYRRIAVLSETLGVDLTAKFIQRSGMMFHGKELIQDGKLSLDDLKIIADRFNMKSHHNLKGFLTVENILATYPDNTKRG